MSFFNKFNETENCVKEAIYRIADQQPDFFAFRGPAAYAPLDLICYATASQIILTGPEAAAEALCEINWSRKCGNLEPLSPESVRMSAGKRAAFLSTYERAVEKLKRANLY